MTLKSFFGTYFLRWAFIFQCLFSKTVTSKLVFIAIKQKNGILSCSNMNQKQEYKTQQILLPAQSQQ